MKTTYMYYVSLINILTYNKFVCKPWYQTHEMFLNLKRLVMHFYKFLKYVNLLPVSYTTPMYVNMYKSTLYYKC